MRFRLKGVWNGRMGIGGVAIRSLWVGDEKGGNKCLPGSGNYQLNFYFPLTRFVSLQVRFIGDRLNWGGSIKEGLN